MKREENKKSKAQLQPKEDGSVKNNGYSVVELDIYSVAMDNGSEGMNDYEKTVAKIENRRQLSKFGKFLRRYLPWHGDSPREILRKVVFLVALVVFIFSVYYITNYEIEKKKNNDLTNSVIDRKEGTENSIENEVNQKIESELNSRYALKIKELTDLGIITGNISDIERLELEDRIKQEIRGEVESKTLEQIIAEHPEISFPDGISAKYAALYAENTDMVGWISVPNTIINYPVVQTDDNQSYLKLNFAKNYSRFGTIFADYRSNLSGKAEDFSRNTVIYGHYLYTGTMFTELRTYKTLSGYKSSPVITFDTLTDSYKWKVFAVFIANTNAKDDNGYVFNYTNSLSNSDGVEDFIAEVKKRSIINTDVDVCSDDKLLTLSTCDFDFSDARLVVVARMVRDGESEEVNVSAASLNPNPKYPQAWYDKKKIENPFADEHVKYTTTNPYSQTSKIPVISRATTEFSYLTPDIGIVAPLATTTNVTTTKKATTKKATTKKATTKKATTKKSTTKRVTTTKKITTTTETVITTTKPPITTESTVLTTVATTVPTEN